MEVLNMKICLRIQWIIRLIDNYIRQLLKKFRKRDKEKEEQLSIEFQKPVSLPPSDEVYLLKKYKWLILRNQSNITYHTEPRRDSHFRCLMNTFDYEDALFRIDPNLRSFRELKERYVQFNARNAGKPIEARKELDELIRLYNTSKHEIFREFDSLLEKYKAPIINSFIMVEKHGDGKVYKSRLSNGHRNRFLYATRGNPVLIGSSGYNPVTYYKHDNF